MPRSVPEDPYVYAGTDVLKNKLGIRDGDDLAFMEGTLSTRRLRQLEEKPVKGSFDITHYADTHHAIFKDVYPFAGEFRTVEIRKWSEERQDYSVFLPAEVIVPWLNRHLNEEVIKKGRVRDLRRDEFIERSARLYLDLNAFHPFREGNGRTQREFVRTLALNAGYELDWNRLDKKELLTATLKSGFDPTKKDLSLHEQFSKAIVNATRDVPLQQRWDQYVLSNASNMRPPTPPAEWRGSLTEALLKSEKEALTPVAFVSAEWKSHARIRVQSAPVLAQLLEKVEKVSQGTAVYTVRDDGAVHNTVTGRDEYLRVTPDATKYPMALREAVTAHFREGPRGGPPSGRGRDPGMDEP